MQNIWIIHHKVFSDSTDSNNEMREKRRIYKAFVHAFRIFRTFLFWFIFFCIFFFCFDRSFSVLFRNAQLPLMRSKPSTPELYKFHSILLGRFRFVNKRQAGDGTSMAHVAWSRMAKRMVRKSLCDFYLKNTKLILCFFRLHTRGMWQRHVGVGVAVGAATVATDSSLAASLAETLLFQHMQIAAVEQDMCSCNSCASLCCSCSGKSSAPISHSAVEHKLAQ